MTLEFEKLSADLDDMAASAFRRQRQTQTQIEVALRRLHESATDWPRIELALGRAEQQADAKHYRSARPLDSREPLDSHIPVPPCPAEATLIATDGSQILPDRHAAFLYYLINVGVLVYHHGRGQSPDAFTRPSIEYPRENLLDDDGLEGDTADEDEFVASSAVVNVRRDLAEIGTLADIVWEHQFSTPPVLAVLDQRLLYWPALSGGSESKEAIDSWLQSLSRIRDCRALLAGYIDRPGKSSVMTLLKTIEHLDDPTFDFTQLGRRKMWSEPTDVDLFSQILEPGERSKIFVDHSEHNTRFRFNDEDNEVCFFYLNPSLSGQAGSNSRQIARVDIPMWVARQPSAVDAVHALLYDQCQLLGDYPYVLTRADEMAVVGRQDQAELDHRIALRMQSAGLEGTLTAKQTSKDIARGGKTRHEI
jgi:hypothetical protein